MSSELPPPLSPRPRRAAEFAALLGLDDDHISSSNDQDTAHRVAAAIRSAGTSPARSAGSHHSSRGRSGSPALSARSARSAYSVRSEQLSSSRHARTASEHAVETFLSAPATPRSAIMPEIRTTSPSPQRPAAATAVSSQGRRSPSAESTASRASSTRSSGSRGSYISVRDRIHNQGEFLDGRYSSA